MEQAIGMGMLLGERPALGTRVPVVERSLRITDHFDGPPIFHRDEDGAMRDADAANAGMDLGHTFPLSLSWSRRR